MPYTERFGLSLGPAWTGIAADIRAQLLDDTGAAVDTPQSGAIEIGGGEYVMLVSAADGWAGFVRFYSATDPALVIPTQTMEAVSKIDTTTIHDALNTWAPETTETPPPIILSPAAAEDCRLYAHIGDLSGASTTADATLADARLTIVALPALFSDRLHAGTRPPANITEGSIYWDVVQGATVRVSIPSHGLEKTLVVPASSTANIPLV